MYKISITITNQRFALVKLPHVTWQNVRQSRYRTVTYLMKELDTLVAYNRVSSHACIVHARSDASHQIFVTSRARAARSRQDVVSNQKRAKLARASVYIAN